MSSVSKDGGQVGLLGNNYISVSEMLKGKKKMIEDFISYIISNKPRLVQEARDWARDSIWDETEEDSMNEFIDEIAPERLLKLINRHYEGGLRAFVKDNEPFKLSHTILHKLASIANDLDARGFSEEANGIDDLLVKLSKYNAPRAGKKKKRWSIKYKKNINCNNPKGFSQKQYCKRKKRGGGYQA